MIFRLKNVLSISRYKDTYQREGGNIRDIDYFSSKNLISSILAAILACNK